MASTKKKKGSSSTDKVRSYYDSLDLRDWWEEFSTECRSNGTQRYKTVWSFIKAKTKVPWQRDFLWWILGPKAEAESTAFEKYTQYDWESKREKGFWHSSSNIKELREDVRSKKNALAAMKELGKINLDIIGRYAELSKQIDREYNGRLFLPELDAKENMIRVKLYMQLQQQLLNMQTEAQTLFGKTQGLDLDKLTDFFALFGQGMGQAAGLATMGLVETDDKTIEGEKVTPASKAMSAIMSMVVAKAAKHELNLPDKDMDDILINASKPTLVVAKKG